jgi:tRNA (cytidine/uridine-2'-O-)-methyltransferase
MVGRESAGVPTEIHEQVDEVVTIPISKSSRSLNVSTAAAIALSEAMRQLKI